MLTITLKINETQWVVHGTALVWNETGILLIGPSGSGKSDFALRSMDKGAQLIADDQIILTIEDSHIFLSCPIEVKNKIEAYGLGVLPYTNIKSEAKLSLICALTSQSPERVHVPAFETIGHHQISKIHIDPFWPSMPEKLKLFLNSMAK